MSGNALAVYEPSLAELATYAEKVGTMVAEFCNTTPKNGAIIALCCAQMKITPLEFQRTFHLIEGKASMRSDAMLAEFRKAGGKHKILERTPDKVSVELTDKSGETQVFSFTWAEALEEDFTHGKPAKGDENKPVREWPIKHNYSFPRKRMQMLWARVVSDGVRAMCPEINAGLYTPEEVEDFQPAPRVAAPKMVAVDIDQHYQQAIATHVDEPIEGEIIEPDDALAPEVAPAAGDAPHMVSQTQRERIEALWHKLGAGFDARTAMLEKRGVKLLQELTAADAADLIDRLEGKLSAISAKN
jgi:hypothetical protein